MAYECMCGFIHITFFSGGCPFGLVFGLPQWLETNDCNRVHFKASMDGKGCEGKEKGERERRSGRNAMEGDRKQGGRVRERERETEGDRRRKSLRHG